METILRTVNISKRYQAGGVTTEALKDVSLNLKEGTILAVMGSSGSGKSTLLHILGGLEAPDSGQVFLQGGKDADYLQRARSHPLSKAIYWICFPAISFDAGFDCERKLIHSPLGRESGSANDQAQSKQNGTAAGPYGKAFE